MKIRTMQWMNTISLFLTVLINVLANLLPIGIGTTGAVTEKYPSLFTPAPLTFGIWGLIYFMLALFLLYQWGFIGHREETAESLGKITPLFVFSCALNIGWIFAWHFDVIWLSTILILVLLITLALLTAVIRETNRTGISYIAVNATFDLYFGWIIAASLANFCITPISLGWNGFGLSPVFWTCIALIVGTILGAIPVVASHQWMASLAVIWAYIGICIRHIGQNGYQGEYPTIIILAIAGIFVILMAGLLKKLNLSCHSCEKINDTNGGTGFYQIKK